MTTLLNFYIIEYQDASNFRKKAFRIEEKYTGVQNSKENTRRIEKEKKKGSSVKIPIEKDVFLLKYPDFLDEYHHKVYS